MQPADVLDRLAATPPPGGDEVEHLLAQLFLSISANSTHQLAVIHYEGGVELLVAQLSEWSERVMVQRWASQVLLCLVQSPLPHGMATLHSLGALAIVEVVGRNLLRPLHADTHQLLCASIKLMARLAERPSNRGPIAEVPGLIPRLIEVLDDEADDEADHVPIALESGHILASLGEDVEPAHGDVDQVDVRRTAMLDDGVVQRVAALLPRLADVRLAWHHLRAMRNLARVLRVEDVATWSLALVALEGLLARFPAAVEVHEHGLAMAAQVVDLQPLAEVVLAGPLLDRVHRNLTAEQTQLQRHELVRCYWAGLWGRLAFHYDHLNAPRPLSQLIDIGLTVIFDALTAFRTSPNVAAHASRALGQYTASEQLLRGLTADMRVRGVELLRCCLRGFHSNSAVREGALVPLFQLLRHDPTLALNDGERPLLGSLVRMFQQLDNVELLTHGAVVIGTLAVPPEALRNPGVRPPMAVSAEEAQRMAFEYGALEVLVNALARHPEVVEVQYAGWIAVNEVLANNPVHCNRALEMELHVDAVNYMGTQLGDWKAQEIACGVLYHMMGAEQLERYLDDECVEAVWTVLVNARQLYGAQHGKLNRLSEATLWRMVPATTLLEVVRRSGRSDAIRFVARADHLLQPVAAAETARPEPDSEDEEGNGP